MKKVLCTIMGAVALLATLTSCGNMVEKEEVRNTTISYGYCCPTETFTKQVSRKVRESGYADKFMDFEYINEEYDVEKDIIDTEIKLIFKDVNGFEKYTMTTHVKEQNMWVWLPGEPIEESVEI